MFSIIQFLSLYSRCIAFWLFKFLCLCARRCISRGKTRPDQTIIDIKRGYAKTYENIKTDSEMRMDIEKPIFPDSLKSLDLSMKMNQRMF